MAFELNKLATDRTKETEGVWEDIGGDASLLVARIGNEKYKEGYKRLPKGTRRMIENQTIPDDQADDIICGLFARTILLDWKNLSEGGKDIPYSEENAKQMMLKYPEFRELVSDLANDFQRFHEESVEGDVKNSKSASAGN